MSEARAAEYRAVVAHARSADLDEGARQNTVRRLRGELRRIGRRDYFPPPERAEARRAVDELAASGEHEEATR